MSWLEQVFDAFLRSCRLVKAVPEKRVVFVSEELKERFDWKPVDAELLYPGFLSRIQDMLQRCSAEGFDYYPTCGYRSYAEQAKRYKRYKAGKGTRAAPAGYSAHNFGCAIDFVLDKDGARDGVQADWHWSSYKPLAKHAKAVGLVSGIYFNDAVHIQIPDFVSGREMAPLRQIYEDAVEQGVKDMEALEVVWKYLDKKLWR